MNYVKHVIQCKCILPQFKNTNPVVFHSFIVFSVFDEMNEVQPSFAKCTNCGVVHKITEVGVSTVLRKEDMPSLPTIEEIKNSLPEQITKLLSSYELNLATWQEIKFIFENKLWDVRKEPITVILLKEQVEDMITGKYLIIYGETLMKINTFTREEFVTNV